MRASMAHVGSAAGRTADALGQAGDGAGGRRRGRCSRSAFILQHQARSRARSSTSPASWCWASSRYLIQGRHRRPRRPDRGAGADRADDLLFHLLPADVDLADPVRAAQRRSAIQTCSACTCSTWIAGAVPGLQSDLDLHAEPGILAWVYTRMQASAARTCRSRRNSRSASPSSPPASSSIGAQRLRRRSTAGCRPGAWSGATASDSLGELLVSGLGLAMIARYVPARDGRLHDGRVLRGVRHFAIPGQRGRQLRQHPGRRHRPGCRPCRSTPGCSTSSGWSPAAAWCWRSHCCR